VFDKSRNGSIKTEDFRDIINNLGEKLTQSEIKEILKEADLDDDGNIDYMEFVKMMMSK
jgi:Ca2+-binding EF-hand superfamily protein